MTTTVSLSFAALTIDAADPAALADFWGKALGRPVSTVSPPLARACRAGNAEQIVSPRRPRTRMRYR